MASSITFELFNSSKSGNFIAGELHLGQVLVFIVANEPKTNPQTGCSGKWMFTQMMDHFGANVVAIKGSWHGSQPGQSDNLDEVNARTTGGLMTVLDAAWFTWTGKRAAEYQFTKVSELSPPVGTPGQYTRIEVLFAK